MTLYHSKTYYFKNRFRTPLLVSSFIFLALCISLFFFSEIAAIVTLGIAVLCMVSYLCSLFFNNLEGKGVYWDEEGIYYNKKGQKIHWIELKEVRYCEEKGIGGSGLAGVDSSNLIIDIILTIFYTIIYFISKKYVINQSTFFNLSTFGAIALQKRNHKTLTTYEFEINWKDVTSGKEMHDELIQYCIEKGVSLGESINH
jgi:hypothetical protein